MPGDPSIDLPLVLSHYDLGELQSQSRDLRGTVNTSFVVELLQGGRRTKYFLRRYRQGIAEEEIRFEHGLIDHVSQAGVCPVARVHRTRNGDSYLRIIPEAEDALPAYFAVFDFLPGEDRYTWVGPRCTPTELRRAGELLARFHNSACDFRPPGRRVESKILDLLPEIGEKWAGAPSMSRGTEFDQCVEHHFDEVRTCIDENIAALRSSGAGSLPELIIHSDYHPGNLKFVGEEISGLVDFDWAKLDLRAFDVGLAIWYFCASWELNSSGALRLEDVGTFVSGYQRALSGAMPLSPLGETELRLLPAFIQAGNLYVLCWTLRDYFGTSVDPAEHIIYLEHSLHSSRWLLNPDNRQQLERVLAAAGGGSGSRNPEG